MRTVGTLKQKHPLMAATKCCFNLEWNLKAQELEHFFSCQPSQRIVSRAYTFNISINGMNDQITFFLMCYPKGINKSQSNHNFINNNNNNIMNKNCENKVVEFDYHSHIGIHLSDIPLFIHQMRTTVKFKLPQIQNYGHFDSVIFDLYNNGDYFTPLGFMSFNKFRSLISLQKTNKCIIIQCNYKYYECQQ